MVGCWCLSPKQRQWLPGSLHCKSLFQQMFLHATAMGQNEHGHAICWGWRYLGVESTAMELVGPNSTCQDIEDLYQDVYQLWRLSGRGQCKEATEDHLHKEILDLIKECLRLKWPSTPPEAEQKPLPANTTWPHPHAEFAAAKKFTGTNWVLYEEMIALIRDAHQWTLVAATILEERMEWMSCFFSHWSSGSHQHSGSCDTGGPGPWDVKEIPRWPEARLKDTQVDSHKGRRMEVDFHQQLPGWLHTEGGTIQGWTQSPSPTRQKCQVNFTEGGHPHQLKRAQTWCQSGWGLPVASTNVADWGGATGRSQLVQAREEAETILVKGEEELESPPPLEPQLEQLLGEEKPSPMGTKAEDGLPPSPMSTPKYPEPSPLHQLTWINWHTRHVPTLPWWKELVEIPSHDN